MSLSPVDNHEAVPNFVCSPKAAKRFFGPDNKLVAGSDVAKITRQYAKQRSDRPQFVKVQSKLKKTVSWKSKSIVVLCAGGIVDLDHRLCVNIKAVFATGCFVIRAEESVCRIFFSNGTSQIDASKWKPSTPSKVSMLFHPLRRSHVPLYFHSELESLFLKHFSGFTKLIATKLQNQYACALSENKGGMRCTECGKFFENVESWAKHYQKPPLLLPVTTSWTEIQIANGKTSLVDFGKPVTQKTLKSPRPHKTCEERSLADAKIGPALYRQVVEKLMAIQTKRNANIYH